MISGAIKTRVGLAAVALAFVATAMLFVPRLGIEADEALVGNGIYEHGAPWYSWHFGDSELPVMLISYLGALKTWFYSLLFWIVPPRPVSLRLPMVLIAAATLVLFFLFLDRTVGRVAAWIGTLLLATDPSYVLMNAADYGPVTLQFFLKLAALVLIVKFHQSGSRSALAGGFFLLGLAMWDKAVFAWVLCGFALAAAVFYREVTRHLTLRHAATASLALLLGAFPLVIYNLARPLETLRNNAKVESAPVLAKAELLRRTMDGSALSGFMIATEPGPEPGSPRHWYQSLAIDLSDWSGHPRRTFTMWAVAASVLGAVFLPGARRPVLFAALACLGAWLPMVLTAGAGAAAQHVILLWPFHFMAIAAVLAQFPVRWATAAATAVLCAANLSVTDQYYADLVHNGPALRWTDAMDPLDRVLADLHASRVFVADWGIVETVNLLSEGETPVSSADVSSDAAMRAMLESPGSVFVEHATGLEFLPAQSSSLEHYAAREGYQHENIAEIHDRNGRPAFDVFRFRKIHL